MKILTKISVSHALNLSYNIRGNYINYFSEEYKPSDVSKYFGIFVTILRSEQDELENWPRNFHGCQGNWSAQLENKLNKDLLVDLLSSTDRAIKDKRSAYFKNPLFKDIHCTFKISLMHNVQLISDNELGTLKDGEIFSNDRYGLLVKSKNKRATFLPNIFKNESWNTIKAKLVKKAKIENSELNKIELYTYKTETHEIKLLDFILSKQMLDIVTTKSINAISYLYENQIPYSINRGGGVTYDKGKDLRNMLSMVGMLKFKNKLRKNILSNIENDLNYYYSIFLNNKKKHRQSSSFLSRGLASFTENENKIKNICEYSYENIDKLGVVYERGEVLTALAELCPDIKKLNEQQKKMYMEFNKSTNESLQIGDLYQINWEAQFLRSLYLSENYLEFISDEFIGHMIKLEQCIYRISSKNLNENTGTIYIVVMLEAVMSLANIYGTNLISYQMYSVIFECLYILLQRYKNGHFMYKSGDTRIDVTGHMLNCISILNDTLDVSDTKSDTIKSNLICFNFIKNKCFFKGRFPKKQKNKFYGSIFLPRWGMFDHKFSMHFCKILYEKIKKEIGHFNFQICGLETGSIPILTTIPIYFREYGVDINSFVVKKEKRNYGLQNIIDGFPNEKDIVIIDDIYNSGGTYNKCKNILKENGYNNILDYRVSILCVNPKKENIYLYTFKDFK